MDIVYGLEKFNHYCFAREERINMFHKLLVSIFRKDVPTL